MSAQCAEQSLYIKFDEKKQEIRLLILQPALSLDDAIIADVKVVSLFERPTYEAILYC